MNVSGKSVSLALQKHVKPSSIRSVIVLQDSLEHKPFVISPKKGGSANGHNGVKSTIQSLGGSDFSRIRLGIGRGGVPRDGDVASFVLQRMNEAELRYWADPEGEGVQGVWKELQRVMAQ
jgi:peptidyl-tRNA hydrolase, PTH1 family